MQRYNNRLDVSAQMIKKIQQTESRNNDFLDPKNCIFKGKYTQEILKKNFGTLDVNLE